MVSSALGGSTGMASTGHARRGRSVRVADTVAFAARPTFGSTRPAVFVHVARCVARFVTVGEWHRTLGHRRNWATVALATDVVVLWSDGPMPLLYDRIPDKPAWLRNRWRRKQRKLEIAGDMRWMKKPSDKRDAEFTRLVEKIDRRGPMGHPWTRFGLFITDRAVTTPLLAGSAALLGAELSRSTIRWGVIAAAAEAEAALAFVTVDQPNASARSFLAGVCSVLLAPAEELPFPELAVLFTAVDGVVALGVALLAALSALISSF